MGLEIRFQRRDWGSPLAFLDVHMTVEKFGFDAIGGPDFCTIAAKGNEVALFALANWLRAPIDIYDEHGRWCWGGIYSGAKISTGSLEYGVTLDTMANKVASAYESMAAGTASVGERATTAWADDDDSVATFGTKELLITSNNGTQAAAEADRDRQLDASKYPTVVVRQSKSEPGAALECQGLWKTLAWRYYQRLAGLEAYTDSGVGVQALGNVAATTKVYQTFALPAGSAGWSASVVEILLRKEGAPADSVTLDLVEDSAGAPGDVLATCTLAAASIGDGYDWTTFTLSAPAALAAGTTYGLYIYRTGALDPANYYKVNVNEDLGYGRGAFAIWNASAWVARSPDADMQFMVKGVRATTDQLETLLDAVGQFFTASDIVNASGINTSEYRDGDALASTVANELLNKGISGGARLLATVLSDRTCKVYQEPAASTAALYLDGKGWLVDDLDNAIGPADSPAGKWCRLKDVPPTLDVSRLIEPTRFFIERAEYDAASRQWIITQTRGARDPWSVAGLESG